MPTCNLSEIVHNKWLHASGNRMVGLYSVTVDDYSRIAVQSTRYYLYLKGNRRGIEPNTLVLKLRLVSRSENPLKVARLVDEISSDVGVNTRVSHLEGEKVFGSANRKLDLPPRDDNNSHHHDHENFSVPKLLKIASPGQCHTV